MMPVSTDSIFRPVCDSFVRLFLLFLFAHGNIKMTIIGLRIQSTCTSLPASSVRPALPCPPTC